MHAEADALRWDLSDVYASPDDPKIEADLSESDRRAKELAEKYRGRVAALAPAELASLLRTYEGLMDLAYRPNMFASLVFAGATDDQKAQALINRTRTATTEAFNQVRFIDVELKRMDAGAFDRLAAAKELEPFRHFLAALRRFAPHTLSEAEEKLAELKNLTGKAAFSQLYTEVSSRIRIPIEKDGKQQTFNVAEARALRSSPDRALRRRATDGLMKAFEDQSHVLNFCFNTLYQDHQLETELRGFSRPELPTFLDDELSAETVETLMRTTEEHYPLAQRYMKLKARAMGIADFASHDLLAPIDATEQKVPYARGRQMVLDAFGAFEPRFSEIAGEFFERRWIDALPRQGKRDGAFCSGMLPSLHPYVLLNYNERIEDVSTLAHELGHAIHFYLSRQQTPLNFWPTTPLAETASVFGELLLMRRLMAEEKDETLRRHLLAIRIEDILSTVFNQVQYTRWEQKAHAARAKGVVPADQFSKLWMDERRRLYGDAVQFLPQDRWGWISIPHFVHYCFYCYSYAFGQLLVLALFNKYEQEGSRFIPRYVELLSSGNSGTPQEMLARVGIDIEDPRFWHQGFKTLEALLDEFERLV
jgi:oligoendopeptidase F